MEEDHPDDRDRADDVVVDADQDQRPEELLHGAEVREEGRLARRQHVLRIVAPEAALHRLETNQRRVADHGRHNEREVPVQLRRGCAPPDEHQDELPADDPLIGREEGDDENRDVDLRPGAEEGDLVPQAEHHEQDEQDRDPGGRQPPGRAARDIGPAGEEEEEAGCDDPGVEGVVGERPVAARGQRHPVRPRRQPHRPGPQPIERTADRRLESEAQGHRAGAQPQQLPEQRPDRELLEDDRLAPPVGEVAERPEPGRQRDHRHRAREVDDELEGVKEVDEPRRAEAVQAPVLHQGLDAGQVRLLLPLLQVKRRR
jgi:hypothetical protein